MKISELEVGSSYTRGDDALYMVIFIDSHERFFIALTYSYNHRVMHPLIYTQEDLDQDYNENLEKVIDGWTLSDILEYNNISVIDENILKDEG